MSQKTGHEKLTVIQKARLDKCCLSAESFSTHGTFHRGTVSSSVARISLCQSQYQELNGCKVTFGIKAASAGSSLRGRVEYNG